MELTDMEKLLLEVLLLRHRYCESDTELDERFAKDISSLVRKGFIVLKHSVSAHKVRVTLTEETVAEFFTNGGTFPPPRELETEVPAIKADASVRAMKTTFMGDGAVPWARAGGTIIPL